MQTLLSQVPAHDPSAERLKAIYASGLIAPEKKPFLIDLARSTGPYMAVDGGGLILDGASQIASIGLGFNAGALFGAAQYVESWTNQSSTPTGAALRTAYERLLQRLLGSDAFSACFCASGAEANETVLGYLFQHRKRPEARRVVAFQGSFHGRMMIALASTWNPAKREPFTWPGHESIFAPYPVMEGDDVHAPAEPEGWQAAWATNDDGGFEAALAPMREAAAGDPLLASEIASLTAVRAALADGEALAMLIEPMQCEGGDRYSSRRFHQGLVALSCAFDTPLVYDEIQTGFGLGAEFFWHRKFCLQKPDGQPFYPAGVVCAKKAQAGVALVNDPQGPIQAGALGVEQTSVASIARGYIQASVLDQFHDTIVQIETDNRRRLAELAGRHAGRVTRPRAQGLSFAFDLDSTEEVGAFVAQRFAHGLLYYPAGAKTARFRVNLGFSQRDNDLFWSQLESALGASFAAESQAPTGEAIAAAASDPAPYHRFHQRLASAKLAGMRGELLATPDEAVALIEDHLAASRPDEAFDVVVVDRQTYADYRDRIVAMQSEVYEPARQSSAEEFDALFRTEQPLAIVVLSGERIVAMAFSAPLAAFRSMRGVANDPWVDDPRVQYSVDLTIAEAYRGGLGRVMKQAMTLLAMASGADAVHGRNRDRLAAGMWAINLSLGAHELQHLPNDYPDEGPHRDCIYYRCETRWSEPPIDLGAGVESPLGPEQLDDAFIERHLPVLVNKITLSNFVTGDFLSHLEGIAEAFPPALRQLYTASGLSEAVDKIAKVLWRHRQPRTGLLTIEGADFGAGSFLARSLSGGGEPYFAVDRLPPPTDEADEAFFDRLEKRLAEDDLLGVFVEPLMRRTMRPIPADALRRLLAVCRERGVPVVFNESASLFYRYSDEAFGASGVGGLLPDAAIAYLGGQTAVVAASSELFLNEPLLLISTWDGDALSLAQFHRAMEIVQGDPAAFFATRDAFHAKLVAELDACDGVAYDLRHGVGSVHGAAPAALVEHFRNAGEDGWLVCPSYSEMLRFNRREDASAR